ncbi:hypothetical protein GALL_454060 [mine drainage metagenome]|uniref:Uncharacterized protein n=1 Tax=mine drainage metagenome TaxID=410659 RepID=A0A1J5PZE3_9ZZZZ
MRQPPNRLKPVEHRIGAVVAIIGVNKEIADARRPVMGEPFEQKRALVAHCGDYQRLHGRYPARWGAALQGARAGQASYASGRDILTKAISLASRKARRQSAHADQGGSPGAVHPFQHRRPPDPRAQPVCQQSVS